MPRRVELCRRVRPADRHRRTLLAIVICICGILQMRCGAQSAQTGKQSSSGPTVRIGVFTLFHPRELIVRPAAGSILLVEVGGRRQILSGGAWFTTAYASEGPIQVQFSGELRTFRGDSLRAHAQTSFDAGQFTQFWLEAPGKLRREYTGTLEIRVREQSLEAIVTMPLETAVASVVQAESPPGAGVEALKAQAVAARSFFAARQASHRDFDFCDSTHCQFLRSPPAGSAAAGRAARETKGLVLTWHDEGRAQDRILAAMYARSCGGRTRSLGEIGIPSGGYPYYAVRCAYCSRHPEIWRRALPPQWQAAPENERDRLIFDRIHGWAAIPSTNSNAVSTTAGGKETEIVTGRGVGHGIGLCQLGAADMARKGSTFAEILAHYYPNTRLVSLLAP